MNKIAATMVIGMGGLVLGLLTWTSNRFAAKRGPVEVQFRGSTSFDYSVVRDCLQVGNRSRAFGEYVRISASVRGPPDPPDASTYVDPSGSMLMIRRKLGRTVVQLKSARSLSDEQTDLLSWCVQHPQTTWISPRFRAR